MVAFLYSLTSCAGAHTRGAPSSLPLGRFVDDYGSTHEITVDAWRQDGALQFSIRSMHASAQYFLAAEPPQRKAGEISPRGDRARETAVAETWARVDWMLLDDPQWRWAYCITAYQQATADRAESDTSARRATPRTGCHGYPFTRMRSATTTDTTQ